MFTWIDVNIPPLSENSILVSSLFNAPSKEAQSAMIGRLIKKLIVGLINAALSSTIFAYELKKIITSPTVNLQSKTFLGFVYLDWLYGCQCPSHSLLHTQTNLWLSKWGIRASSRLFSSVLRFLKKTGNSTSVKHVFTAPILDQDINKGRESVQGGVKLDVFHHSVGCAPLQVWYIHTLVNRKFNLQLECDWSRCKVVVAVVISDKDPEMCYFWSASIHVRFCRQLLLLLGYLSPVWCLLLCVLGSHKVMIKIPKLLFVNDLIRHVFLHEYSQNCSHIYASVFVSFPLFCTVSACVFLCDCWDVGKSEAPAAKLVGSSQASAVGTEPTSVAPQLGGVLEDTALDYLSGAHKRPTLKLTAYCRRDHVFGTRGAFVHLFQLDGVLISVRLMWLLIQ